MKRFVMIAVATIVASLMATESADACRRCCRVRCCRPVRMVCCQPCGCHSHIVAEAQAAPTDCGCGGSGMMTEMGTVIEPQPSGDVIMEQPVTAPPAEPANPEVPKAPTEG